MRACRSPRLLPPLALLLLLATPRVGASAPPVAPELPPGGKTAWAIDAVEVIVTFLIFDPEDPAVALPTGLRFVPAHEVPFPELQEHLKDHPERSDWAFSFVEFVRPEAFVLDGKALALPEGACLGVWLAPVDASGVADEIPKDTFESVIAPSPTALLTLGFWVPDREYVDHMRARGHHAEYGMATLVDDGEGAYRGRIRVGTLDVQATAVPHGETRDEPEAFTQVLFAPGDRVDHAVILAGGNVRERDCTAEWSKQGDHPLSRGVFVGPTFQVREGPFRGSAYRLREGVELPPGGMTAWEVRGVEEIVTFLLFDPATPGVSLPTGLRFVPAREIGMPEIQEHLERHPEHADWVFSVLEIIRDDAFLLDGKAPARPEGGATGLWMAEVDPAQLAAEIGEDGWNAIAPSHGAMLVLGLWIPDPEYAAYMRARGHHAEYGMVTLVKDAGGTLHGEITSGGLHVEASAAPHGEARDDLVSGTQVQFAPGERVEHVIVIAGENPRHRDCIGEWSKSGDHPLARGVFVGPTFLTTYPAPLTGSAYPLRAGRER